MNRPNIVYIHSHDTGRYVQPYGHAVATPNIQRLAEEGILFRRAFCAAPTCSPSRAALLTGQCAHCSGMVGLAHRGKGFALNDYSRHIIHALRGCGYYSALAGVQHVADDAAVIGYDEVLDIKGGAGRERVAAAVDFLGGAPERPFFLSVGFIETHRLWDADFMFTEDRTACDPRYCIPPAPLPDTPATRRDMANFYASAELLDRSMGAVFDALEANGLAGETLVICTTDHGIAFPLMKCNLTDHGTGVMLIMRGPGGFSGGKVCDAMVSHVDVFPTICELLGIDRPDWLAGRSMMPLVRGEAEEINEEIFAEVTFHAAYEPKRAVRTRRWKYIRRYDGRTRAVLPNCDDGPSKDVLLENGWRDRPTAAEQLYDLIFDPNEAHNLAADPAAAPVLAEMRSRLDRWMEDTGDPLLKPEHPEPPSGARLNDPDAISVEEGIFTVP